MENISPSQAAKLLDISVDKLRVLEKQGLIHSTHSKEGVRVYFSKEIARIKSRRGLTFSEEAALVNIGIQREMFSSLSGIQKILILAGSFILGYLVLTGVLVIFFFVVPLQTSDFFGYYYRYNYNAADKLQATTALKKDKSVLAAVIGPAAVSNPTSVIADIIKPVAVNSLIVIKAIDSQKYTQIISNPVETTRTTGQIGIVGPPGANGVNGTDGLNGLTGLPGLTGLSGLNGTNGTNGTNGSDGINGIDGTSVADILTTAGSIIIRNGANATVPLSAGSDGQVLTISGGIPVWEDSGVVGAFSGLAGGINTSALMMVGSGASLSATGSGTITANSFSGIVPVSNGGTGVDTLTINGVLFGNGTGAMQITSEPINGQMLLGDSGGIPAFTTLTGDATITGDGLLTLKSIGIAGTYGSVTTVPVITIDAQGRVAGVTDTGISGLTASNLTAGDFSSKINSGTYSINISGNANTANNATSATNVSFSGLTGATNTTAAMLVGNGASLNFTGAGTINASSLIGATFANPGAIGGETAGSGIFTTLFSTEDFTASGNFATLRGTDYLTTGVRNDVDLGTGSYFHYAGNGTATFTGFAGGTDGRLIRILNDANYDLTITHQDSGSLAANRIEITDGARTIVPPESTVSLIYDSGSSRWHLISLPTSVSNIKAFAYIQGGNAFGANASFGTTDGYALNFITGGNTRFTLAPTSSTLTGTGATILTSGSTLALSSAASSGLTVTSGTTGALTLDSGTTGAVNLGIGANPKIITIGNNSFGTTLAFASSNFNTTTTGINSSAIGTTTPSTGAFTSLSSAGITNLGQGTGVVTLNSSGALNLTGASASTWTLANVVDSLNIDANTLSINALNNRVGIGTAAPGFGLSVLGNTSSGNVAAISNLNTTDSATSSVLRLNIGTAAGNTLTRFIQFFAGSSADNNGTGVGNIKLQNSGVQYVSGNADLAEWTDVAEAVAAGDIISSLPTGNKKAVAGNLLLGVVTDTAAFVGNETADLTGKAIVGMLGRVNTKVSTENGNIAIGDPMAASSVAGVGMKQTKAGPTIGKALAAYSSAGVGRIAIQVVPGWFDPDALLTAPGSFSIAGSGDVMDQHGKVVTRIGGYEGIVSRDATISGALTIHTDNFTDLTGDGLTMTSGALGINLTASGTTGAISSNSGLEISASGLTLLKGCADLEILRYTDAGGWACAGDGSGGLPTLNTIAAAMGANAINNADNSQVWNWRLTTAGKTAFTFGENSASINGAGSQYILGISTLAGSTASPLKVSAGGNTIIDTTNTGGLTFGNTTANTPITLQSGTGAINIGADANAKIITFGNTTGATGVNINAGTGNINFTVGGTDSSGRVQIGNSGTATPDLLVLDSGTADPTGVNGGMYYNTTTGKMRCYEGGAWKNCAGSNTQQATANFTATTLANSATFLGTFNITPTTATGDVYVYANLFTNSLNNVNQTITAQIRSGTTCAGTLLASGTSSLTSSSGNDGPAVFAATLVVNAGAFAQNYAVCALSSTNNGAAAGGVGVAMVIDSGADLAEVYTASDASIEAGDVVSLDSDFQTGMKKSRVAYDRNVLGIVSTRPGLVIGNVDKEGLKALPVALSGRVTVKVSSENGKISAGDYLTTSSTSGVAMRATRAGVIIGTAMTSFDGEGVGQILAFVRNGVSIGNDKELILSTEDAENIASDSAESVKTGSVTKIVSDLFKNAIEFLGSVIFHSDVTFLGRPIFNKDTAGHAIIKAGDNEISIAFEKEYATKPVVTANVNLLDGVMQDEVPQYAVYGLSTKGFKIRLAKVTTFDLDFSWIALSVNGVNEFKNSVFNDPGLSPTPGSSSVTAEAQSLIIIPSLSSIQEIAPSPTVAETASISAQAEP